ncbi:nucleoside hydrolase [Alteribacter populi]|uniref:nucleoside hydrolase n=1 Tax=Alteribacter populi TaxID=2011011 RepID=UPI000BBAB19E|nr:nucleoside hydrolase [Alteribacter populi]
MLKVLLFADPGIDDSMAIMYALLHPEIEVVGIVTGYGNVDQEQATDNVAYLLSLAEVEDVPLFSGARYPLSGEIARFYPEIHGEEGLGPIEPPVEVEGELLNFTDIFDLIDEYENELTIIDVGRLTSLAMAFILGGEEMEKVKEIFVMGGAFLIPGNATPLAEANFYGDPIAANLIMERAENLTIIPLNVSQYAIVTDEMIADITKEDYNSFTFLIEPIFDFYSEAYEELVPGLNGAPFHDVLTVVASVNPEMFDFIEKVVSVSTDPETRGQSIADFRPDENEEEPANIRIAMDFVYDDFADSFREVMKIRKE